MYRYKNARGDFGGIPAPKLLFWITAVVLAGGWQLSEAAGALTISADGLTVDDPANGITWLADANLAAGNRFGLPVCTGTASSPQPCINPSGSMNYPSAAAWVAAMNAANYLGHSDWQLPTNPPHDDGCGRKGPNGNSFGFGCSASAFGTLYNALGLKAPSTAVPIPAKAAPVQFAGLISPGLFQFKVVVPPNTPDGDQPIMAAYNGLVTQPGTLITIQH